MKSVEPSTYSLRPSFDRNFNPERSDRVRTPLILSKSNTGKSQFGVEIIAQNKPSKSAEGRSNSETRKRHSFLTKLGFEDDTIDKKEQSGKGIHNLRKGKFMEPQRWIVAEKVEAKPNQSISLAILESQELPVLIPKQTITKKTLKTTNSFAYSVLSVDLEKIPPPPTKQEVIQEEGVKLYVRPSFAMATKFSEDRSRYMPREQETPRNVMGEGLRHIPTCNIFVSASLQYNYSNESPFAGLENPITARQLCLCMENLYTSGVNTTNGSTLSSNDIVVCSPPRTGQTPILNMAFMLLRGKSSISQMSLLSNIRWIGGGSIDEENLPKERLSGSRRLFKSHSDLARFLHDENTDGPKVIVVLRDPLNVYESWYRHLCEVYRAYENNSDYHFSLKDFKHFCPRPLSRLHQSRPGLSVVDEYEQFIGLVLRKQSNPNLCIVFYEDVLSAPQKVVEKLYSFMNIDCDGKELLCKQIANVIKAENSAHENRFAPSFSKELVDCFQLRWSENVDHIYGKTYKEVYEELKDSDSTSSQYLHSMELEMSKKRESMLVNILKFMT